MPPNGISGSYPNNDIARMLGKPLREVGLDELDSTVVEPNGGGGEIRPFDAKASGWQEISGGTFVGDARFKGKNLLAEMPKTPPKGYELGMDSVTDTRDVMFETCVKFKEKFIDRKDFEERLGSCRKALERMPEGPERQKLEKQLEGFRRQADKIIREREHITRFLPVEKRAVKNLNASETDRAEMARRDMRDAYVALRNLDYDLKRAHGKFGTFAKFTNYLSQTFTTTRNSFFRAIQHAYVKAQDKLSALTRKGGLDEMQLMNRERDVEQRVSPLEIQRADSHYDAFVRDLNAFAQAIGDRSHAGTHVPIGELHASMSAWKADEALKDIATIKEALYAKTGGTPGYSFYVEQNLLETFKGMTKGDSGKEFVLTMQGGVAVPVPVAELSADVKYEYTFKVHCGDDKTVRIEYCHAGGAEAKAAVKGGLAEAKAHVGGKVGIGTGTGFVSPEDAAREIASGKQFPLVDLFVTNGGDTVAALKKLVLSGSLAMKPYQDGRFIVQAQKRGLLHQTDSINFKDKNVAYLDDRTFKRIGGGGGADVQVNAIVKVNAGARMSIERDIAAYRTRHCSYYAYFTADRVGEAQKVYEKLAPERGTFDDPATVRALLARRPATEAERRELAQDILAELKAMTARETAHTLDLIGRDTADLPDAEALCADCRQGTLALVALEDKLKSLGLAPDKDFETAFATVRDELRDNLLRPRGMALTKDELLAGLYVDRTHADNVQTTTYHFGVGYDALGGLDDLMGADSLLGKAGVAATKKALANLGAKMSASVDVTHEVPKGDDPRLYRQKPRTRIDITLTGNLTGRAIVALIQDSMLKAAEKTGMTLAEQKLDAKSILSLVVGDALEEGFEKFASGAFDELKSLVLGGDDDSEKAAEEKLVKLFTNSSKSGGMLVSFIVEDGRLSAAGFGKDASRAQAAGLTFGIGHVSAGFSTHSKTVSNTVYATPSFDSLVAKCDDFLVKGHGVALDQFAMTHKNAFLRMARILGGNPPSGDKLAADDIRRFERTVEAMRQDIETCPRKEQRERLLANLNRLFASLAELRKHFATDEKRRTLSEQQVVEKTCDLLKAVTVHYNALESLGGISGALGEDLVKNIASQTRDLDLGDGSTASGWTVYG